MTVLDGLPLRPCKLYDSGFMASLDGHVRYQPTFATPLSRENQCRLRERLLLGAWF